MALNNYIKYFLLILLGAIISFFILKKSNSTEVKTDADIIIQKLKSVKKLIVTEGYFSEIYSYKEAQKYFYNLIRFEKKALLMVKGKVQISYDLEKMTFKADKMSRTIFVSNIPKPEISIEPTIKYYDLKESTFNTFETEDYNKLNSLATQKLRTQINKSSLQAMSKKSLQSALQDMQWVGNELGWKVKIEK